MIVVDVNVLIYSLVAGRQSEAARLVFDADPDWIAPSLLSHEFLNILATWERKGIMSADDCQKTWQRAAKMIGESLVEADPDAVLKLAMKHRVTAYDAQYVLVAQAQGLTLVTEDGELLRKFPRTAVSMVAFLKSKRLV
jgi:predicted nucleic acid-binding protein